jgi:hypothetical protein
MKILADFLDTDNEIDLAYENIQIFSKIPADFLDTDSEILTSSWMGLIVFCKCLLSFLSEIAYKIIKIFFKFPADFSRHRQ